jgi:hypothetical protein
MACNGLHYAILSSYSDTWFLHRPEGTTLHISPAVGPTDIGPTLRKCVYHICRLALQDNIGPRFAHDRLDNYTTQSESSSSSSSEDDDNGSDDDFEPSEEEQEETSRPFKKQRIAKEHPLPPKQRIKSRRGIVRVNNYISSGSFGKVFSGKYDDHAVAWKTCDAYKEPEKIAALKNEAHIYTILEECQGIIVCSHFY